MLCQTGSWCRMRHRRSSSARTAFLGRMLQAEWMGKSCRTCNARRVAGPKKIQIEHLNSEASIPATMGNRRENAYYSAPGSHQLDLAIRAFTGTCRSMKVPRIMQMLWQLRPQYRWEDCEVWFPSLHQVPSGNQSDFPDAVVAPNRRYLPKRDLLFCDRGQLFSDHGSFFDRDIL